MEETELEAAKLKIAFNLKPIPERGCQGAEEKQKESIYLVRATEVAGGSQLRDGVDYPNPFIP